MVLWLIAIAALGTAIYFRVYQQPWLYSALGIGHRRWDDDFYGGPPLVVHKRHPLHVPTDPALERVRAATEGVDTQRYESLSQALQVVHHARDNFPPGAPVILLPLLLGIILKWCCRRKEARSISPSSFYSETSRHGHLTPIEQLDDELTENREQGRPTQHSHRILRRRFSEQPLVDDFPVLSNNAEASSAESHDSHRAQEVTTADTIQQWLRGMALPLEHRTRRPTDFLSVRASDVLGLRAGREVPRRSRGKWCRTAADTVRGTHGNGIGSDFVERWQDCAGSARKDGTEEIAVFGDYDDEGKSLLELSDDPSDCEGSEGEERRSGGGDADRSDINTSGLSEETSYMELPKSELSSATPSTCSLEVPTQDAWFSVAATLDPLVAAPASRPSPVQQPRNVFEQLLEACGQQEPASFSAVLAELGVQNCVKIHESEHADIFLVYSERGDTMVLKVYDCAYIMQHICCVINEIRIARSLTTLANGVENQTGGFPQVHMARCFWDSYPPLLESACTSYLKRTGSADFRDYGRKLYPPYAVIFMENAGQPFSKMPLEVFDSPLQIRAIVQQVALALAVAETELLFEHRALTLGHVLLKPARRRVAHYRLMNNALSIELHGWEASVVDFTSSRMTSSDGWVPIYVDMHDLPDDKKSALGKRLDLLQQMVRPKASRFSPYTNVIFLHDLVHELREAHKQIFDNNMSFCTDAELKAWEDVTLWAEEIASCRSARDFVIARVLTSAAFVD